MITITIKTDNAAFTDGPFENDSRAEEIARILRSLADSVAKHGPLTVRDYNGNICGAVKRTGKDRTV